VTATELIATGAAIVATLARPGEPIPSFEIDAVGYGAGTRTLADRPNLLRRTSTRGDQRRATR
jgi:uncharacterized protein (DUF111 family)